MILHWDLLLSKFGEVREYLHNIKKLLFLVSQEKALGNKTPKIQVDKINSCISIIFSHSPS